MRIARVKVLQISGLRNKLHNLHDVVNENQFVVGRFDQLLNGDYIELLEETQEPATPQDASEVVITTQPVDETPQGLLEAEEAKKAFPPEQTTSEEKVNLDDTTRKEIMADLDKARVKYNKNASKAELYEIWRELKQKV
jgi:hypothetical protein